MKKKKIMKKLLENEDNTLFNIYLNEMCFSFSDYLYDNYEKLDFSEVIKTPKIQEMIIEEIIEQSDMYLDDNYQNYFDLYTYEKWLKKHYDDFNKEDLIKQINKKDK